MWSLEHPAALFLFFLIPGFIYFIHFRKTGGGKLVFNFCVWAGRSFKTKTPILKLLSGASHIILMTGFCLLIFSLTGPVIVCKERTYLSSGIDLIIALDVSPSMSARDSGKGRRIDAAREVIRSFVQGRENDSIGLVAFGKEAALKVPPTLDYRALNSALELLRIMELGDGTAIGMGIMVACVHLNAGMAGEKVIILLTDGDNNAGKIQPVEAAQIASSLGIRLYTIGIGREGETTLEFTDPQTGKQVRGVYRGKFNAGLLKEIASLSKGRYFQAGSMGTLKEIFKEINSLEKTEQRVVIAIEKMPKHNSFILIGTVLIMIAMLIRKVILREVL